VALGATEEQDLLRTTARQALEKAFPPDYARRLLDDEVPEAPWPQLARLGWFGIGIDEAAGGAGGDFTDQAVVLHEMGRVLAPAGYSATAVGAAPLVAALGSPEQRAAWLEPLLSGARLGVLVAGPDASIEAAAGEGGLALSGETGPLPGVAAAQTLVVATDDASGGTVLSLVDRETTGVTITPVRGLDATAQLGRVSLNAVQVRDSAVLGALPDTAAKAVEAALDRLAVASVAELVGAGEKMQEMAVEYAKVREQFGKPIGSFQAIKHMAADMVVRLESSRAVVHYAALSIAEGRDDSDEAASAAKAYAAEAIGLLAEDALQVHGGIGFTWEHPIHLYVRRAASVARLYGSGDMHRERVAQAVGL
jgi:alkylation response protein AidB-like acyl-CoA dehydrogenase